MGYFTLYSKSFISNKKLFVILEIHRNREFYRTNDVRPPFTYASLIRQVGEFIILILENKSFNISLPLSQLKALQRIYKIPIGELLGGSF